VIDIGSKKSGDELWYVATYFDDMLNPEKIKFHRVEGNKKLAIVDYKHLNGMAVSVENLFEEKIEAEIYGAVMMLNAFNCTLIKHKSAYTQYRSYALAAEKRLNELEDIYPELVLFHLMNLKKEK
jgi:hypothetical protein